MVARSVVARAEEKHRPRLAKNPAKTSQPSASHGKFERLSPPVHTPNPQIAHSHNHAQRTLTILPSNLAERMVLLRSGLVIRLSRVCFSRSPLMLLAARKATPYLRRPPSEYIVDHIKLSTQPWVEPPKESQVEQMLDMMRAERTLVFSSDFPHWDGDEPMYVAGKLPERIQRRVLVENAAEALGDRIL